MRSYTDLYGQKWLSILVVSAVRPSSFAHVFRCCTAWLWRCQQKIWHVFSALSVLLSVRCSDVRLRSCDCLFLSLHTHTYQSGQRAVRYGGRELNDDQIFIVPELLHLHTLLRHDVQLLQSVGLLRIPNRPNHICENRTSSTPTSFKQGKYLWKHVTFTLVSIKIPYLI